MVASAATLDVAALGSGYAVPAGQTLGGQGTVLGSVGIGVDATLSPGASPGTLAVSQDVSFAAGGNYNWQITSAATVGDWDLLTVGGALQVTSTSADPFRINLWTLSGTNPDVSGPMAGFDAAVPASWTIATASGGITGFASDLFLVNTAATNGAGGFANPYGSGTFAVAQAGNDLQIVYTPGSAPTDIVIDVPSGSQTQSQAGYPTIAAATSVRKIGAGTVVFDAANAYTGPTTIAAGTLQVANAEALGSTNVTVDSGATLAVAAGTTMKAPTVIVDGGTLSAASLAVNTATGIASLAINAGTLGGSTALAIGNGGQMSLVQDARVSVGVASLAVAEAGGGGRLDIGAGQVAIAAGGITAAELRADIIAGRNNGGWNGATGIISSTAAAAGGTRAVGYVVAGDGSARVSYAASGDVDLSGAVNVFDLVSINSSGTYGTGATSVWSKGDFNYDGVTNVFDLVGVNTAGVYGQGNYFPATPSASGIGSAAAVPEPSLGLGFATVLSLFGCIARRSRRATAPARGL
jgi:autotransporter-associated beta strand protein